MDNGRAQGSKTQHGSETQTSEKSHHLKKQRAGTHPAPMHKHVDTSPTESSSLRPAARTYRPIQHVQHDFEHCACHTHRNPRTENAQAQCHRQAARRNGGGLGGPAAEPPTARGALTPACPTAAPIPTRVEHSPARWPTAAAVVHVLAQRARRNQRRHRRSRAPHSSPRSRRQGGNPDVGRTSGATDGRHEEGHNHGWWAEG